MFSVGMAEVLVVIIVAVLVLKPEQMVDAMNMCRGMMREWRAWRARFDAEQVRLEKEHALAERIARAAAVSDVSDLLETDKKTVNLHE